MEGPRELILGRSGIRYGKGASVVTDGSPPLPVEGIGQDGASVEAEIGLPLLGYGIGDDGCYEELKKPLDIVEQAISYICAKMRFRRAEGGPEADLLQALIETAVADMYLLPRAKLSKQLSFEDFEPYGSATATTQNAEDWLWGKPLETVCELLGCSTEEWRRDLRRLETNFLGN